VTCPEASPSVLVAPQANFKVFEQLIGTSKSWINKKSEKVKIYFILMYIEQHESIAGDVEYV
jgi:hypothetical protein